MFTLEKMCEKYFHVNPKIVGPGIKTGLNIKYDNPREVGADRIVNAVAGIHEYGSPLIIVDFGTATTFCYINEKSEYMGGVIAPGIGISTEALYNRACKASENRNYTCGRNHWQKYSRSNASWYFVWICWTSRKYCTANH